MNKILKEIVLKEINYRYKKERVFYETILKVEKQQWKYWKNNNYTVVVFEQKITNKLFTVYEWELAKLIAETYKSGIGISSYYNAYLELKFDMAMIFLNGISRVAVKDIDPNQIHAEKKYRVPRLRIYIENTYIVPYIGGVDGVKEKGTGNIVTLIISGETIDEIPIIKRHFVHWVLVNKEKILKGV